MSSVTVPGAVDEDQPAASKAKVATGPGKEGNPANAGWFTRIALDLICLLWIVPTIGLFVTSWRTVDDANTTGWWTVLYNPARWHFTTQNYHDAIVGGNLGAGLRQQLRDRAAGDVHPAPDRVVRRLRVHVHGVQGPGLPVPRRSSACWSSRTTSRSCRS